MNTAPSTGHPRRWVILGVLVVSLLVVILDTTVLNVALRVIADPQRGLGATQSDLEWATNSYTLVFAGLLFTWGVLGDRLGRKKVLLLGLLLFGIASVASAYAQTPGQLIAARALMGIGGGEHGFGRPRSWGTLAAGLALLVAFVLVERRVRYPSLDVTLFRNPRFSAAVGSIGLVFFAAMGTFFFMAFYLQLVRGYSPL